MSLDVNIFCFYILRFMPLLRFMPFISDEFCIRPLIIFHIFLSITPVSWMLYRLEWYSFSSSFSKFLFPLSFCCILWRKKSLNFNFQPFYWIYLKCFLQHLLRHNWQNYIYLKCTTCWFGICILLRNNYHKFYLTFLFTCTCK